MLRVGKVSFSNTEPLFYRLKGFKVVEGLPSELAGLLRAGRLDAGIVSSVEYFFNPELYFILPGVSISSVGRVCSVKLFAKKPFEELKEVKVTRASLTSRYLLKFVAEKAFNRELKETDTDEALLLIGDEAMRPLPYPYAYDLGELWYELTGLPFVFALFLVRREVPVEEAERLLSAVRGSLEEFFKQKRSFYFNECIDYALNEEHLKGLELFFNYLSDKTGRRAPSPLFLNAPSRRG
ncbi:MAG: menaquinone biosynthesis protein [Aquificae bacterium]|nr:menaquinone biosynthesis protein [Aquificota bacterium]